ncbi:MAG: OmpA family protein [Verrucomicrobiales bacterium]|nr:OmpA family protein [Verrucomicrobiales bacterium]MBP9226161.1 OmpA family protein [Verrucomicrobiales bacterium]
MNKTTALIFFGIILVGTGISIFTLNTCGKKTEVVEKTSGQETTVIPPEPDDMPKDQPALAKPKSDPKPESKPEPVKPVVVDAPAVAKPGIFKSPEAALTALAEKIGAKDFQGFLQVTGPEAIAEPIRPHVQKLVENPGLKLDTAKPYTEISKSADGLRWALNFVPTNGTATAQQLYADLTTVEGESLDITKISFPLDLTLTRSADMPVDGSPATSVAVPNAGAEATPDQNADALTVAHAFSKAVIQRDFNLARKLSDPSTVTDERVAALMIAIEEGKFVLKEDRPLVVTLSRDDITWVLTRVQSDGGTSEFALELGQIDKGWKVNGLTFSKVLSALSEKAGGGDVAYSPIVDDPSGGDSLVLYFEFDESGLTPRTSRQLAIVADILAQGEERVIRINGHADALGTDDYNIALSNKRAEAIRQILISMGVKPKQVVTEAFGAAKPRKPNFLPDGSDNPSGRSQNRRAEVLLDF